MEPSIKPKLTAKDFFLSVGVLVSLYVYVTSLLSFLFDVINYAFPDRLSYSYDPYSSSMRFALSTLIVAFPLFLLLINSAFKSAIKNPEKKQLSIRKWFIYLTLFLTTLTVAIDLIILINTFLGGEITTRFILKVLAVLVIIGGIFWTSLLDLREVFFDKPKVKNIAVGVSTLIVLVSIIGGLIVIGSPANQRDLRDDSQRVSDLQSIQWEITNSYQTTGKLPVTLSELADPISGYVVPTDPKTMVPYEYKQLDSSALSFELCATFAKPTSRETLGVVPNIYPTEKQVNLVWEHQAGHTCFDRNIDPLKYPYTKK